MQRALFTSGLRGCLVPLLLCVACGGAGRTDMLRSRLGTQQIAGMGRCTEERGVAVARDRPLTVLVHGDQAAVDHFDALAKELEGRGHEVLCYRWEEHGRLTRAAADLRRGLIQLDAFRLPKIRILGHSLGGLAARRAVTRWDRHPPLRPPIELATIATPFSGVDSAWTCSQMSLRVVSMGAVAAICRRFSRGAKWRDIHPDADFIEQPGELGPWVQRHIHVITHERGHCRRRGSSGRCLQDDHVFDPSEQTTEHVAGPRLHTRTLDAGHGASVGEAAAVDALLEVLETW